MVKTQCWYGISKNSKKKKTSTKLLSPTQYQSPISNENIIRGNNAADGAAKTVSKSHMAILALLVSLEPVTSLEEWILMQQKAGPSEHSIWQQQISRRQQVKRLCGDHKLQAAGQAASKSEKGKDGEISRISTSSWSATTWKDNTCYNKARTTYKVMYELSASAAAPCVTEMDYICIIIILWSLLKLTWRVCWG